MQGVLTIGTLDLPQDSLVNVFLICISCEHLQHQVF